MGPLIGFLLALGLQAAEELGQGTDWVYPVLVPVLLAVPYLFAWRAHTALRRGRAKSANRQARLLALSPALLHYVAVGVFGWRLWLEELAGHPVSIFAWPSPWLLLLFLPYVGFSLSAIDAEVRLGPRSRGPSERRFQTSMLAGVLVPATFYVCLASLVRLSDELLAQLEEVALWGAAFSILMLFCFALALPVILQRAWATEPIPAGPRRELLETVADRAGFRCKAFLLWNTGNLMANAAIVGLLPSTRVVLFSDSLLSRLGPRELAAVAAHEIGHARRHHVATFLAWTLGYFMAMDLLVKRWDPTLGSTAAGLMIFGLVLWFLGFGWLSRRAETEADLFSMELTGDPYALRSALDRVGGHLRDVAGWRHFSMAQREDFLWRASADPEVGRKLRRSLGRIKLLGLLFLLVAGGLQLRDLVSSWDRDQVIVDLRRGRFSDAEERLAAGAEVEPEVEVLVSRAREVPGLGSGEAAADTSLLRKQALEALTAGRTDELIDLLRLAQLRGDTGAVRLQLGLEHLADGEEEAARKLIEGEDPVWWERVRSRPRRDSF